MEWANRHEIMPIPGHGRHGPNPPPQVGTVGDVFDPDWWSKSPAMAGAEHPDREKVRAHVEQLRVEGYLVDTVPVWWDDGRKSLVHADELYSEGQSPEPKEKPVKAAGQKKETKRASKKGKAGPPVIPGFEGEEWREVKM